MILVCFVLFLQTYTDFQRIEGLGKGEIVGTEHMR